MESLSFGLTTKPALLRANNTTNLKCFEAKKAPLLRGYFSFTGGLDGTRTRDPMRDRHVF